MRRACFAFLLALIPLISLWSGNAPIAAQGTVYSDTMDSPESGLLSTDTWDPAISFAYQNGQFVVNVQGAAYQGDITSTLSVPELADSTLSVDATIAGDPANKYVFAGCRHTDAGGGYLFGYWPATGELLIWRRDTSGDTNLAWASNSTLISGAGSAHQIGIDCTGNVITGIVDGQFVVAAYDGTYTIGRPTIGLGANGSQTDGLQVAYDNLTVTDTANQTQGTSTLIPPGEPEGPTSAESTLFHDPAVEPEEVLADAFAVSLRSAPVASGLGSDTPIPSNAVTMVPAQVALADFYAEVFYIAPSVPANGSFVVGFCFWADAAGNCTDVYLQSTGNGTATWGYGYAPVDGTYQSLQTGTLPADATIATPGEPNFLSLTVYQGYAILSSNTFDADVIIPLQAAPIAGDVKAEIGFIDGASTAGSTTTLALTIRDFAVWDLSSGTVPPDEDE